MLDDLGRPWAGNFHRQRIMQQRVERIIRDQHPIDIAGALGTIMANIIADAALTKEEALKGLEQHAGDLRVVIEQRFAPKATVN